MSDARDTEQAARELIAGFSGDAAFLARNLATGVEIGHVPDRVMPTASTIKLLVLAELYRQADAGTVDLALPLAIHPDDRRGGSGILKDLLPDVTLAVRDHAILMTALSDNTATMTLVRLLGLDTINASARNWGMTETAVTFRRDAPIRTYATSTPRDIVHLLALIAEDAIISPAACGAIRDVLLTQQYHDQIARYLPFNPYAREGYRHEGPVIVRAKSGFTAGVRVDAGIVELPNDTCYILCLMTENSADRSFRPEQEGAILNGRISRLIFDAWWPAGVAMPED